MITRTNKNTYLSHAEIAEANKHKGYIKNPELLAFIEESNTHYKKSKKIRMGIISVIIIVVFSFFYLQNKQHLKEVSQQLEITKAEKQKVITAQSQTENALVEANHNYAQALNQKALMAKEGGNFEYAKLYALTALKNSNNNADLVESLNIMSEYGTDSSRVLNQARNNVWGRYNKIAISQSYLATTASHNDIQIWNLETQDAFRLTGHTSQVVEIKFLPSDPSLLLSVLSNGELRLWNLKTRLFQLLPKANSSKVIAIDFSKNGKVLATSSNNGMQVIDMDSFQVINKYSNSFLFPRRRFNKSYIHSAVEAISLNSNGSKVAYTLSDSSDILNILDIAEDNVVFSDTKQVKHASNFLFSKNDNELIFGKGKNLVIWNIATNNYKRFKGSYGQIKQVMVHLKMENIMTYHQNGELRSWSHDGKVSLVAENIHGSLSISHYADKIFSIDGNSEIKIYDYSTGKHINNFGLAIGRITALAVSPDDRFLVLGKSNGVINTIDLITGKISIFQKLNFRIIKLHFSDEGKSILAVLNRSDRVAIVEWNIADGGQRTIAEYMGNITTYFDHGSDNTVFSNDGGFLAFIDREQKLVRILNINTGEEENIAAEKYNNLALNNDGLLLMSNHKGSKLWDWTSRNYKALAQKSITGNIVFAPTGSIYAAIGKWSSYDIEVWTLEGVKLVHLKIRGNKKYRIRDFRFSSDSKEIYVLGCDKLCSITKWDLAGNKLGETQAITNVKNFKISSDNTFVITFSNDGISVYEKNEPISFNPEWHKPKESLVNSLLNTLSFDNVKLKDFYFDKGDENEKVEKYKERIERNINTWSGITSPWHNKSFNNKYVLEPSVSISSVWDMPSNQFLYKLEQEPNRTVKKIIKLNNKGDLIHSKVSGNNKYKYEVLKGCKLKIINISTSIERTYENVCTPGYFSEDSQYLIFSELKHSQVNPRRIESEKLKILNLNTFKVITVKSKIRHLSIIKTKPTFSPNGKFIFFRSHDNFVLVDIELGEVKFMTHSRRIREFEGKNYSFSHNSEFFIYVDGSQSIVLNLKNNKKQRGNYEETINRLLIHPSNEYIAMLTNREIHILPINSLFATPPIVLATIATDIYFSPDGKFLLQEDRNPFLKEKEKGISLVNFESFLKNQANWEELLNKYSEKAGIKIVGMDVENTDKPMFQPTPKLKLNWSKHHPFYWQEKAVQGDPEALLQLGIIAQRDKKWNKAKEWYQKAKAAGHKNADYRLEINELMRTEYLQ